MSGLSNLKPKVRLFICSDTCNRETIFGKGVADLCLGVQKLGSLNASAKNMHMAYSKAWRIVKESEKDLGIKLLDRDGAHGSTLTPEAIKLLDAYYSVEKNTQNYASKDLKQRLSN